MLQIELNGKDIETKELFMNEIDRAFELPPYFGKNWDALWECLNDLYWIKENKINIRIHNTNELFGKHKVNLISFFNDLTERSKDDFELGKSEKLITIEYL